MAGNPNRRSKLITSADMHSGMGAAAAASAASGHPGIPPPLDANHPGLRRTGSGMAQPPIDPQQNPPRQVMVTCVHCRNPTPQGEFVVADPSAMSDIERTGVGIQNFEKTMLPQGAQQHGQNPMPGSFPTPRGGDPCQTRGYDDRENRDDPGMIGKIVSYFDPRQPQTSSHTSREIARLQKESETYQGHYLRKRNDFQQLTAKHELHVRESEKLVATLKELQSENEEFRARIFSLGTARGQIRDEEIYAHTFEDLRSAIEQGMVKMSRAHAGVTLNDQAIAEMAGLLELGAQGKKAFELLGADAFTVLYANNRARLPLIRNLVAAFLSDHILDPFALAASPDVSAALQCIETDFMCREKQFSNVLLVHQALGRGAMLYAKNNLESRRREYIGQLSALTRRLLPNAEEGQLINVCKKIIDRAIEMKNMMMEEQALFHTVWVNRGDELKETDVEPVEEEPGGKILLCVFPGLARTIIKDEKQEEVIVVKALVNTERAFVVQM